MLQDDCLTRHTIWYKMLDNYERAYAQDALLRYIYVMMQSGKTHKKKIRNEKK